RCARVPTKLAEICVADGLTLGAQHLEDRRASRERSCAYEFSVSICSAHRVSGSAATMTPVRIVPMSCVGDLVSFVLQRRRPKAKPLAKVARRSLPALERIDRTSR